MDFQLQLFIIGLQKRLNNCKMYVFCVNFHKHDVRRRKVLEKKTVNISLEKNVLKLEEIRFIPY